MDSLPGEKVCCHHTGFTKKCRALVTSGKCNRWVQVQGLNRNTGEQISRWDCVDNWGPVLQIEGAQMTRETGAAIETLRNEVSRAHAEQMAVQSQELLSHLSGLNGETRTKLIEQKS